MELATGAEIGSEGIGQDWLDGLHLIFHLLGGPRRAAQACPIGFISEEYFSPYPVNWSQIRKLCSTRISPVQS